MGFRTFVPLVAACPGCGRHDLGVSPNWRATFRPTFATKCRLWKKLLSGVETLNVAVMGCIVMGSANPNTPTSEFPCPAPVKPRRRRSSSMVKKAVTLRGEGIAAEFKTLVQDYIERRFGATKSAAE